MAAPTAAPPEQTLPIPDRSPDRGPTAADPSSARSLHRTTVVTPEAVVLDFATAGIGSRSLALTIDLLAEAVLVFAVVLVAAVASVGGELAALIVILVGIFLILFGYPALFEAFWGGQTPGKRALGIRVITTEGGPVGLRHGAIRSILALLDFWFPSGGLVALCCALVTSRSQRLGDLAAGTVVVRTLRHPETPVFFAPVGQASQLVPLIDGGGLKAHQYSLVREFLLRAGELEPGPRDALARDLAARVAGEVGYLPPPGVIPEQYLVAALVAHQQRFAHQGPIPGLVLTPPPFAPPPYGAPVHRGPVVPDLGSLPPPQGPPVHPGQ